MSNSLVPVILFGRTTVRNTASGLEVLQGLFSNVPSTSFSDFPVSQKDARLRMTIDSAHRCSVYSNPVLHTGVSRRIINNYKPLHNGRFVEPPAEGSARKAFVGP